MSIVESPCDTILCKMKKWPSVAMAELMDTLGHFLSKGICS